MGHNLIYCTWMKGAVQCPVWLLRRYIYFTACDLYWLNVRCVFWVCTNMTSNITLVHSDSALLLKRRCTCFAGGRFKSHWRRPWNVLLLKSLFPTEKENFGKPLREREKSWSKLYWDSILMEIMVRIKMIKIRYLWFIFIEKVIQSIWAWSSQWDGLPGGV